jgi:benzoylformate decarboxylase
MAGRTGGELIQDFLATYEIPYVFGNPGTTETTFLAAVAASKATYILALHESSAVGIAAGYALITGKPSIVSLHTYPGLANGMFNMRNALMAGVPLLVINGQQDSRFLIHNPVLGAPNTQLAQTATKYSYEVTSVDDLAVALQRCYLQARLQPTGPVFLSIPMNFMLDRTAHATFKKTRIIEDTVPRSVGEAVRALKAVPAKKLAPPQGFLRSPHRAARASLQRGRLAREAIEREGMTFLDAKGKPKPHPLLVVERDSRAAALAAFRQLNLELPRTLTKRSVW